MPKLVLTDVTNINTAASTLNANFAAIEAAFEDILSRSGEAPNEINSNVDVNSYRLYNLAPGVNDNDAATVGQLIGASPVGQAEPFTEVAVTSGTYTCAPGSDMLWIHNTGAAVAVTVALCPALDDAEFIIERAANYNVTVNPSAGETIIGGGAGIGLVLMSAGSIRLKCRTAGTWTIIADSAGWNFSS